MSNAMKVPGPFPGVTQLPRPARSVLEFFFPQPEIAMPMTTVVPSGGVAKALMPLTGSLQHGKAVARDVLSSLPKAQSTVTVNVPEGLLNAHPTVQEMWYTLTKPLQQPDPARMFSLERSMIRPPLRTNIVAPEGFAFSKRPYLTRQPTGAETSAVTKFMGPMKRDPLVDELSKRYNKFNAAQLPSKVGKRVKQQP